MVKAPKTFSRPIPGNNSLLLRFVVLFISRCIMLCHVIMSEFFNRSGSLSILLLHLSGRAALKMQLVRADGRRSTQHTRNNCLHATACGLITVLPLIILFL